MSSKTTSPHLPVDDPPPAEVLAEARPDPAPTGEELPFESPEFGVGAFFPHLDTSRDG